MSFPTVAFDGIAYSITLVRDGKKVTESFGDHTLSVCACHEKELASWERALIKGPVAADDMLYYLCARPHDVGSPFFVWLQNKEEADLLQKVIWEAEDFHHENGWREDSKCTFCGYMDSECGGDHGDEMRQIMREAVGRDY
jgi:hypothetical protein